MYMHACGLSKRMIDLLLLFMSCLEFKYLVHMEVPRRPEKAGFPRIKTTKSCEPPDMSSENQTQVCSKSGVGATFHLLCENAMTAATYRRKGSLGSYTSGEIKVHCSEAA